MSNVTDITGHIREKQHNPNQTLDDMIALLGKYKDILEQSKKSGHIQVGVKDTKIDFEPTGLAVILGNGETILREGMDNFNAVELLGLNQAIRDEVFDDI